MKMASGSSLVTCHSSLLGGSMDYVIAGVAALFLFGYLVYALLRPEKF
jgi:K+-transporting ATPase KdpF subunit